MNETKIQFSTAEMELMCNKVVLLTKNRVIEKVKLLLADLQNEMMVDHTNKLQPFPSNAFSISPKISKGENYMGLPYLILDFPRCFKLENIFAIRTMFWWGNFYSTTLHLSGSFKKEYSSKISRHYDVLSGEKFSIGINEDPWLHHFDVENYREINLLEKVKFQEKCEIVTHLKIAKKLSLDEPNLSQKLFENWKQLVNICTD